MRFDAEMSETMDRALSGAGSDHYDRTAALLGRMNALLREEIQRLTSGDIGEVIRKIENLQPLSDDDLRIMRLWIVGDAESYLEMENNLGDWLQEFARLKLQIAGYENKELAQEELFKLMGLVQDAQRVAADISHFLEKKQRVERFESAVADIDAVDASFIIDLLRTKLRSPDL